MNDQPTNNIDSSNKDESTFDDLLRRAIILHKQESITEALELYRLALKENPDHPEALKLSGIVALQLNFLDEAVTNLSKVASMWSQDPVIHFKLGFALDELGRFDEAVRSYERATMIVSDNPVIYSNLGNSLRKLGRLEDSILACRRAIEIQPNYAIAYQNLGVTLESAGQFTEAIDIFQRSIQIEPENGEVWFGLGNVLRDSGQPEKAVDAFHRSLDLIPDRLDIHNSLCNVLCILGRGDEAKSVIRHILKLDKGNVSALLNLSSIQKDQGFLDDAIQSCRRVLSVEPENFNAQHMLDSYMGNTTDIAPNDYVTKLFDTYAPIFENHLTTTLNYHGPSQMRDAVELVLHARELDSTYRFDQTLDLGCGTGLIATAFSGRVEKIYGVDLSPKMLEKARSKGLYAELFLDDLISFFETSEIHPEGYDLITAADLFIYIGELSNVFENVYDRLRSNGLFVFTTENLVDGTYKLLSTGRYAQSIDYINELAKRHDFKLDIHNPIIIRNELSGPIDGFVYVLSK